MNLFKVPLDARWLRRSRAPLAMLLCCGGPLFGQVIPNPSFEVDAFTVAPGYVSANQPITGWTAVPTDRVGLNPAGGQNPFANNGAVPDGTNVVFIQSPGTGSPSVLGTAVTGLTPGQNYKVNFRVNARTGALAAGLPTLKIALDTQPLLALSVTNVAGTSPYRYGAFDFVATAAAHGLFFTNDAAADTTVLLDNFSIAASTPGWSYALWTNDASSGVDSSKRYTHAYNFGGGAAPNTTINGIPFTGVVGANPGVNDSFRVFGMGNAYGSDDVNVITTAGGGSANLMKRFIHGGNPGNLALFGLTPGVEYVATFYTCAWETGLRSQTFSAGNNRLSVNQDEFTDGYGVRVSYRYVAPASGSIVLSWAPFYTPSTLHLYGFSNCELTPSTTPVIAQQPRSHVSTPTSTAIFQVRAGGALPLSYQWYQDSTLLAGQTNWSMILSNLALANLGSYVVVVANSFGAVTSAPAALTFGPIANPSFEEDVFLNYPGYISANSLISGWTVNDTARAGLNPTADGQSPFASTGTVPAGTQVGFLQSAAAVPKTLSTVLNGLTPGLLYTLSFRANARSGQTPSNHIAIDGVSLLDFRLGSAATTNAYRYLAVDFVPATASPVLTFTNDSPGDHTACFDDFQIAPSTTKWSFTNWVNDATSGVDAGRNYTHAFNFGNAVGTVINDVQFRGVAGANPAGPGFRTAGFGSVYTGDANLITTAGGGSAALMRDFVYGGVPETITLSNLVPFVEYVATIYSVGWADVGGRNYGRAVTFSVGNDRQTINQDHFGPDVGIRVSYRYLADASGTITFTLDATHNSGGTSPTTWHTYGFSNYELSSTNAPIVYLQPQSGLWPAAGTNLTLQVRVGGLQPMSYQWRRDGVDLPDQTNRTLLLSNIAAGDAGLYSVLVSNALGTVVSSNAVVEVGLPVANPSFEVDTFTVSPGYLSNNFVITGWTNTAGQAGINPIADLTAPFANNGAIPDGRKVAFLQGDGTMSQVVNGFTPGEWYLLKFYENSRSGYAVPTLAVTMNGLVVVPNHEVPAGAYNLVISDRFQATSNAMELSFVKGPALAGGDSTLLLDYVGVLVSTSSQPFFVTEPLSQRARVGETATLTARATGNAPLTYQWKYEGNDLPDQTNATLILNNLTLAQSGTYRLVASNNAGGSASLPAYLLVGLPITELFNTGVDDIGALAPGGVADPHYQLISSADPVSPGPVAFVLFDTWPATNGVYMTNGPLSKWISPRADLTNVTGSGNLDGLYVFRTSFLLDSLDPSTAEIRGQWAMDNLGMDIKLNGVSQGLTNLVGFRSYVAFTLTNGFVAGSNTLEFVISNQPPVGPIAFRAELYGVAQPLPPTVPQIVSQPQSQLAQELGDVTFTVLALGSPPLSYQWFYEGFELPGATQRTLRLTRLSQLDQQGSYWVMVSGPEGQVLSDPAVLTINLLPEAGNDFIACAMDRPVSIPVAKLLLNDVEYDGDAIAIVAVSPVSANGGRVSLTNGWVTYTPPVGYVGSDPFTYTLADARGGRATGTVLVTVGAANFLSVVTPPALLPNGHFQVSYSGVAGYPYTVQRATNVLGPWQVLTTVVADGNGLFQVDDPNDPPVPTRFYRVTYP